MALYADGYFSNSMEEKIDYKELALKFADEHKDFNDQAQKEETQIAEQKQPEISDDVKAKAMVDLVSDPKKAIRANISGKIQEKIQTDDTVQQRLGKTADTIIDKNLSSEQNKAIADNISSENDINEANFEKYKNEYSHFGIITKVDKPWKTKIISVINDFWFVVFAIISFFTIVPVSIFIERLRALKGFVKAVFIILGCLLIAGILFGLIVLIFHWAGIDFLKG